MKLWEKNQPPNKKIDHFTVGKDREYDLHLAAYDCQASIAHAQMLVKSGILNLDEADKLVVVLNDLKNQSEKSIIQCDPYSSETFGSSFSAEAKHVKIDCFLPFKPCIKL